MIVKKIVLTGGPGGGKTTALTRIQDYFSELGWRVLIISETATDIFSSGFIPQDFKVVEGAWKVFEANIMLMQVYKERIFDSLCKLLPATTEKVLIVCDRGLFDNKAYTETEEQFMQLLKDMSEECAGCYEMYDAIFHLVTAADGAERFYTKVNEKGEKVRDEDLEGARELDQKLRGAWGWHRYHKIVYNDENETQLKQKIDRLIAEIAEFLEVPAPYVVEEKYVTMIPDVAMLEEMPNCQKQQIIQAYPSDDKEHFVRKTSYGTRSTYAKITGSTYQNISEREYLQLSASSLATVVKTRYLIMLYKGMHPFKLDVYQGNDKYAILKIAVPQDGSEVSIPGYLTVTDVVTNDPRYTDYEFAFNGCP